MGIVAQRYKIMYDDGKIGNAGLQRAVTMGLITADEYTEITGDDLQV